MSPRRSSPDQRGLSESVEWALLTPLVLLCILGLIQAGVILHGRTTARAAALAGAESQALLGAGRSDGQQAARRVADSGDLSEVTVVVTDDATTVTVTVTGRARVFFDVGQGRVSSTVVWPKEQR